MIYACNERKLNVNTARPHLLNGMIIYPLGSEQAEFGNGNTLPKSPWDAIFFFFFFFFFLTVQIKALIDNLK